MKKLSLIAGLALVAWVGYAVAQTTLPLTPYGTQVQSIGPNDFFADSVNGVPSVQTQFASGNQIGVYGSTLAGGNYDNALIGGDFSTNLFQRSTSVALTSATYYVAYGADRWFSWSGTSTPVTMTKQTGSTDIASATTASYRVNKTGSAGVAQICTSQIIESANAVRFQGQTIEFSFDAKAGAGFSAASSNLAVYVSTGTVADEGATYMAYGLNATGGAGTTAWTGQANLGGTGGFLIPITTTWTRYGVAVPIPSTALEIGVSICYTPVGTGGSTDWFEFGKAQVTTNPSMTTLAGTAGYTYPASDTRMKAFARRSQQVETALQQRYTYSVTEPAANIAVGIQGQSASTTLCSLMLQFPVTMRIAPTFSVFGSTALGTGTWKINQAATNLALASTFLVTLVGNSPNAALLTGTTAASQTAGWGCQLVGAGGGNVLGWSAEL